MLKIILCLVVINQVAAWKIFHLGRVVGGNLGLPASKYKDVHDNVTEEYFVQNLDHFSPTDLRTWKQVILSILCN